MADDDPAIAALKGMPSDADVGGAPAGGPPSGGEDPAITALKNMPTDDDVDAAPPPPPTRSLGPPRIHAAAHQPRPPPPPKQGAPSGARGPAPPAAPPPAPSWGQVPGLFAQNIVPSLENVAGDTLEALKPTNWGKDVTGMVQLGKGTAAGLGAQVGASQQDQAVANAFWAAKKSQWGLGPEGAAGLRRSLSYTPGENLVDVASVAAPLEGGAEVAAARLPGVAGDIAGATARLAGGVEAATNPLGYPFRAAGLAGAGARGLVRGVSGASDAAADAADAVKTLQRVHPTEKIPNEMVTGEAAPSEPGVATQVENARARWRKHTGDAATELAGGQDMPHPSALGEAFEDTQLAAQHATADNYETLGNHTGQFDPASFAPNLGNTVEATLKARRMPPTTGPASLDALGNYPNTVEALSHMNDRVADLAANNALTPKNLMAVRQSMGRFYKGADPQDMKGIRTVQEGLDNHIASQANIPGAYQGGNGAQVATDMQKAIDARRQYAKDFDDGPASKAVQVLRNGQTMDATGRLSKSVPGTTEAATAELGKGLINQGNLTTPGAAPVLYNHLDGLMGGAGSKALNDYVRQSVLKTDSQGRLAARPEQIHGFLRGPMSRSAFPTDTEQGRVADLANVERMALSKPAKGTRSASTIGALAGKAARHGASIWAGSHLGPFGAFAGEAFASHVIDPWLAARAARGQFRTPRGLRAARMPGRLGPIAKTATRAGLAAHAGWGATYQTPEEQQAEAEKNDQDIVANAPAVADVAKGAAMGKAPAATPTDIDTVVRMAAAEGDRTPQGWAAVAAVMRNRSLESGHALTDIAAERGQFEAYGNRNYASLQPGSPQYQRILAAIAPVLAGKVDPTGGADSYYAPGLQAKLGRKRPSWDDGTGQMLGTQLFFKGKYRRPHAAGGRVVDMTESLLKRAEQAQRAAQASTKPLLGLSDDTVAQALRVAQRGI